VLDWLPRLGTGHRVGRGVGVGFWVTRLYRLHNGLCGLGIIGIGIAGPARSGSRGSGSGT